MPLATADPGASLVGYRDLREWLAAVEAMGELKTVRGVPWDREMGAMVDMAYRAKGSGKCPAILFDDVPGYPAGYRCLYGMMASPRRFAFTVGGIDVKTARGNIEYLKQYRARMKDIQYIPSVVDACIPYEHRTDFSRVAETSPELREKMLAKYRREFHDILGEELV